MRAHEAVKPTTHDLDALMRAVLRLNADTSRELAQAFDPVWLGILRGVVEDGPMRPGELAEALDVRRSAVDRNARSMAESDLVEITDDESDPRFVIVSATAAGREELRQIDEIGVDFLRLVIEEWNAADVCALTSLLTRLAGDWSRFHSSTANRVRRGGRPG